MVFPMFFITRKCFVQIADDPRFSKQSHKGLIQPSCVPGILPPRILLRKRVNPGLRRMRQEASLCGAYRDGTPADRRRRRAHFFRQAPSNPRSAEAAPHHSGQGFSPDDKVP